MFRKSILQDLYTVGRHTRIMIRLQNLQNNQILVPRILNIMTIRLGEIRHITRQVIKRRSLTRRREQRRSTSSLNEKSPFITRRMPMNLPQPTRVDSYKRS